jgi:hypothetical protein
MHLQSHSLDAVATTTGAIRMKWCAVCGKKTEGPHQTKFVLGGRALVCKWHGLARSAKALAKTVSASDSR